MLLLFISSIFFPFIFIFPFELINLRIAKTSDVLPEPDSPTMPKVSFSLRLKLFGPFEKPQNPHL